MSDGNLALALFVVLGILSLLGCMALERQIATLQSRLDVLGSQLIELKIERAGRMRRPVATSFKHGQRATAMMSSTTYTKV